MDLILIRHAEPIRVVDAGGPADPPLHERGVAQARAAATWLAAERIDAIWSSPLLRARQTAAPIADAQGLEVGIDDDLSEFDKEATSYIPVEELKANRDERWLAMVEGTMDGFDADPEAFRGGVIAAVERLIANNPGLTIAVVCHGGVINAYVGHVLGIGRPFWFEPKYAGISRVAASRSGTRSVVSVNEAGHLRGLLL